MVTASSNQRGQVVLEASVVVVEVVLAGMITLVMEETSVDKVALIAAVQ